MNRLISTVVMALAASALLACGATAPTLVSATMEELDTARFDWRGDRTGLVWLRHRSSVRLTLPSDAGAARARLDVSGVLARLGDANVGAESLAFVGFDRSEQTSCRSRVRQESGDEPWRTMGAIPSDPAAGGRGAPGQSA